MIWFALLIRFDLSWISIHANNKPLCLDRWDTAYSSATGQGRAEGRRTGQQGDNRIVAYVCWCNADHMEQAQGLERRHSDPRHNYLRTCSDWGLCEKKFFVCCCTYVRILCGALTYEPNGGTIQFLPASSYSIQYGTVAREYFVWSESTLLTENDVSLTSKCLWPLAGSQESHRKNSSYFFAALEVRGKKCTTITEDI